MKSSDHFEITVSVRIDDEQTWYHKVRITEHDLMNTKDPKWLIVDVVRDSVGRAAQAAATARFGNGLEKAILKTK